MVVGGGLGGGAIRGHDGELAERRAPALGGLAVAVVVVTVGRETRGRERERALRRIGG